MNKIVPQATSGFPEWLPEEKILEQMFFDIIRSNYERFGFVPIETSAVEKKEVLTAKGGADKEIYGLSRLSSEETDDTNELALHFDLTVPLARYVVQNYGNLTFPFRRYQMQKVWRGERPQSGRFREFYQCDIDVIGDGELSLMTDAEIPSIIYQIFKEMGIGRFIININNRKILRGYLQHLGISEENGVLVTRVLDKIEKIGTQRVVSELLDMGVSESAARDLIDFISISGQNQDVLKTLQEMKINEYFAKGVEELTKVVELMGQLGIPDNSFQVNPRIARGLDYYTGTIYETILADHPGVGSICSGGRYDDLASFFTDKKLPGVGISIGLTRLLSRLLKAGIVKPSKATTASVLITTLDQSYMSKYLELATKLRAEKINTEVFLEPKKINMQMKYANKKGFSLAIIAGSNEFEKEELQIKNMMTGEQRTVSKNALIEEVKKELI